MEQYHIIIIIFGILILILLTSLLFINRLLTRKRKVELILENVMKYVNERASLFERMANFVEENMEEEINLVNKLSNQNAVITELYKKNEYDIKEMKKSEKLFDIFSKLINVYPNLSKNEIYKILVDESEINIERIEYSLSTYNEKAKKYNEFKNMNRINKFISKIFRLSDYQYF